MVGMDDEDHLRAACWNLLWALNQRVTHPELDDRYEVKMNEALKDNGIVREAVVPVVCDKCGVHFGIPATKWRNEKANCLTIMDGYVGICPRCGKTAIIREVK